MFVSGRVNGTYHNTHKVTRTAHGSHEYYCHFICTSSDALNTIKLFLYTNSLWALCKFFELFKCKAFLLYVVLLIHTWSEFNDYRICMTLYFRTLSTIDVLLYRCGDFKLIQVVKVSPRAPFLWWNNLQTKHYYLAYLRGKFLRVLYCTHIKIFTMNIGP